jgi:hypothetical protein
MSTPTKPPEKPNGPRRLTICRNRQVISDILGGHIVLDNNRPQAEIFVLPIVVNQNLCLFSIKQRDPYTVIRHAVLPFNTERNAGQLLEFMRNSV